MTIAPAKFLTTRQLARHWRVSEATIKRWADTGQLTSGRTVGGHRRFTVADVMRFQTEKGLDAAAHVQESQTGVFDARETARQFLSAISEGHAAEAAALLLEARMTGAPLERIFDEVVADSLHRVGDRWEGDEMSVADEHLATSTAAHAVEMLASSVRRAGAQAPQAVCCAAEDELHTLSTLCAQALLEGAGWEVRNLGGHTPFFALAEYVLRRRPALVCVSSTMQRELEHNARDYTQFEAAARARGTRVVLGGEGFRGEAVRRKFPADLHAESFGDLAEFIRRLD